MSGPLIVGLTGQSGAGKSTMSRQFMLEGFYVVNCDRLTHTLLSPDTECCAALECQFPQFFTDGAFDRRKAARALFSDRALLDSYNAAIFPFITAEIERLINDAAAAGHKYVMLDAPTLFEAGADKLCDVIVSCVADEDIRVQRITERDGISEEEARKRFSSQHDDKFFRERSDYVIENDSVIEHAENTAAKIAKMIKARSPDR